MAIDGPLKWRIRRAAEADTPALALLAQATFLEAYAGLVPVADMLAHGAAHNSAAAFCKYLAAGASIWLAEAEGTRAPLGFALLCQSDLPGAEPGDIELRRIYVLERCQGSGLAAALMDCVIAAAQGNRRLVLGVNADNSRAQAFYLKQGFEPAGIRSFTVGAMVFDDYIYARPLTAKQAAQA